MSHTTDCIFCQIVTAKIPAKRIYEDAQIIAFDDINPQAPIHKLIIPKMHISTLNELSPEHIMLAGQLLHVAKKLAKEYGIDQSGYRTVINCLDDGGQEVYHLHLHLLGGHQLKLPIG